VESPWFPASEIIYKWWVFAFFLVCLQAVSGTQNFGLNLARKWGHHRAAYFQTPDEGFNQPKIGGLMKAHILGVIVNC